MTTLLAASGGEPLLGAIVLFVIGATIYWWHARVRKDPAELRVTEAELGLTRVTPQHWFGVVNGFQVDITSNDKSDTTQVWVGGAQPTDVSLGKAGLVARIAGEGLGDVSGVDQRVGDWRFDDAIVVKGRRDEVLALLDHQLRALVMDAIAEGWVLGERRWQHVTLHKPDAVDFARARRGLELAAAVRDRGGAVLPRLVERAMTDPIERVRCAALEVLLESYRDAPESARAFEHAQRVDVPRHRLIVSTALGDHADLTAFIRDAGLPMDLRAAALDALLKHFPDHPEVRALCTWALEANVALRQVARQALGGTAGALAVAEADGALALAEEDVIPVP
jgi:hypothetical protein